MRLSLTFDSSQREAYLNPAVDQSEERFQWGLPDLDGLRRYDYAFCSMLRNLILGCRFLADELSWSVDKIDETILPIIRRMTQRSNVSTQLRPTPVILADLFCFNLGILLTAACLDICS
jgi:hypothetical protein